MSAKVAPCRSSSARASRAKAERERGQHGDRSAHAEPGARSRHHRQSDRGLDRPGKGKRTLRIWRSSASICRTETGSSTNTLRISRRLPSNRWSTASGNSCRSSSISIGDRDRIVGLARPRGVKPVDVPVLVDAEDGEPALGGAVLVGERELVAGAQHVSCRRGRRSATDIVDEHAGRRRRGRPTSLAPRIHPRRMHAQQQDGRRGRRRRKPRPIATAWRPVRKPSPRAMRSSEGKAFGSRRASSRCRR